MTIALIAPPPCASSARPFAWPAGRAMLTAEWRHLAMLNYEIDPCVLGPHIPRGTQLDLWQEKAFVSIVGFLFRDARVCGVRVPFHAEFEEVNLRFYVRREEGCHSRRGVVFLSELVPRWTVTRVANSLHGEKFRTVPMSHDITDVDVSFDRAPRAIAYRWRIAGRTHEIRLQTEGEARALTPGSHEAFIADHSWAYTARRRGTVEHCVVHPPWRVCPTADVTLDCDIVATYGPQFAPYLRSKPFSGLWVDGSPVRVYHGRIVA